MKVLNLIQGSKEWTAHRAQHFNASDAPAMMGCSQYMTRTQLLHRMKTGISAEVDAGTQRRFDDGHRFEALARPLAERIIGEDLYPVTGSEGELSASFDGLTMDESTAFEHKTLNDQLKAALMSDAGADALPLQYRVQMEQQLLVSGARRVLFMASKWAGDELVDELHDWYESDPELRAAIVAGWIQFAVDLAAYVPAEAVVEVVGRTPESLPALRIEVTGMVTASNLAEFKAHALEVFKGINKDLKTDQQFADAEKAVKWCGDVEERLAAAKQHALSQTASIDELFRAIDDISAGARATRLELDKLVKARKEQIRLDIQQEGARALVEYVAELNSAFTSPFVPALHADFAGAMKGKKTVASLRDAMNTTLANAKIDANAIAMKVRANIVIIASAGNAHLFPDMAHLVLKERDDLVAVIGSRLTAQDKAEAEKAAAKVAPAPAAAPSVTPITPAAARQVVIEQQDTIGAFLASRTWPKGEEAKARAVLVEFEKFRAGHQLRKAA